MRRDNLITEQKKKKEKKNPDRSLQPACSFNAYRQAPFLHVLITVYNQMH